jgi:hypothetical protein
MHGIKIERKSKERNSNSVNGVLCDWARKWLTYRKEWTAMESK